MTTLSELNAVKVRVTGLRGESLADVGRRSGAFGAVPSDTDAEVLIKLADYAIVENPGFKGDPGDTGAADNTYTTLANFKASDITRKTASLVGVPGVPDGRFNWTTDSPPYTADDINTVKADSTPLSVGAWVRQSATGVTYKGLGTYLPVSSKLASGEVSVMDGFGVNPAGTDNTAALQLAHDALEDAGGGVLRLPRATLLLAGSITYQPQNGNGVSWIGDNPRSSILKRSTAATTPVFNLVAAPGDATEVYTDFRDFAVHAFNEASPIADAFAFTRMAKFRLENIDTRGMQVGLRCNGSLVFRAIGCNFQGGKAGYVGSPSTSLRSDGSSVTLYPNAAEFIGCVANYNRDYAFDQTGSGLSIIGGDISYNGTSGLATSGGIIFRAGCVAEVGSGIAKIDVRYMEGNLGTGISVEGGMGAMFTLSIAGLQMLGQEAGRCLSIGSGMFSCQDSRFPSPGDTLTIAAVTSILENVYAGTITDTTPDSNRVYRMVNTSTQAINGNGGEAAGLTMARGTPLRFRGNTGTLSHQIAPESGTSRLRVSTGGIGFDAGDKQWAGNLPTYADSAAAAAAMGSGWLFRRPDNTIGVS